MNLSIYLSVFIPLFGGVGLLGFKFFKTFNFYINYFYIVTTTILVFMLGWNLALYFSNTERLLIDWWFILVLFVFLCYIKIIHKISETEHYQYFGPEW